MTSDNKLYRTFKGKKSGKFAGRTFVRVSGYMAATRAALMEAGAEIKAQGSFLLPEGREDEILARLDVLTVQDRDQAKKDRIPVPADLAKDLKAGDMFDFGGETGEAPIIGIGNSFIPETESAHDDRLVLGQATVYVYNANAPKSAMPKPEMTEEERAAKAKARAAALAERDRTRLPVAEGSVAEGEAISVGGTEVAVTRLGRAWTLESQDDVDALKARFPDVDFEIGASVQFAGFEAPEQVEEPAI